MRSSKRSSRGKGLVVLLASLAPLPLIAAAFGIYRGSLAANPDPILETHADTLTTYRGGKTKVQDAKPRVEQRGVNLDGSLREGGSLSMAIAGNPFEHYWSGEAKQNGVRLDTGTWAPMDVDLALPAPGFRWIVGRTYNARADNSGQYDSNGLMGYNFFQTSIPEIVYYSYASDHAYDAIYLVWGADRYAEFKRTSSSSVDFKGKNGAAGAIRKVSTSPETYEYTDQHGNVFTFLGFGGNAYDGQLWRIADPAGNVAYVGDSTTLSTAISNGYSGGRIVKAYDSADRRYTYTYNADTPPHLTQVKAETKLSGTWASPTGVATVGTVDYTYYGNESYGDPGDLKTVTVTTPMTDSGVNDIRKTYYRYWDGGYVGGSNPGYPHGLQLVVAPEGVRQYDWADSTFDDDQFTASLSALKPYASAYFEYDTSHRISLAWFAGQCGCGGGAGTGTHEYSYGTNGSYTDNSGYDQTWARRTVVKRPDLAYVTQVFDETGQPLSHILTDGDPTGSPSKWVTYVSRDTRGCVDQIATPANITAYTHSTGAVTQSSSVGLVRTYTRNGSGDAIGFCTDIKYKTGTSGTAYYEQSFVYNVSIATKTPAVVVIVRPLQTDLYEYPTATTTQYSGANRTQYGPSVYGSQTLSVEETVITPPVVSTANNGGNASDVRYVHQKLDGTVDYRSQSDGTNRITEKITYTNGQVSVRTDDADTPGAPTNFISTGTELGFATTSTYDAQGRTATVEAPDTDISKNYYSVLSDRRLITIQYPKYVAGSNTVYGPAQFRVLNQAGKAEVEGTIAISSGSTSSSLSSLVDEGQSDPIAAIDVGTIAQMTVKLYDETGTQLDAQRSYFAIPASLPGSPASSYYDTTSFGYDDMGRQWRAKTADGTISRTVFDAIGRTSAHWTGLNDNSGSFPGGETSGTVDMVKTADQEYDGASAGGNSYVSKSTRYIQDSGTGKRETSFANDVRGNILLVTNATAPHQLNKYDNQNRRIATGSYSTAPSSSSDPTSTATNRVALSQNFYDEVGRVWKSQRHKIDLADGSDDDTLQDLKWWDHMGRLAKQDGEQLKKWAYDRLGRQIHAYTLAKDNDSTYANAVDDISGDHVLVQEDTLFDTSSSNVILSGRIDRFHSDLSTTGKLDSEADSLPLKYTAANLAGRVQITASWYDALDRIQDRVSLGTNGGSDYDRSGASAPSRSDTALRTTYVYNDDGTLKDVQDPKAFTTRTFYDALGRRTKVVANYTDGTPGGGTYADQDQTVSYAYTNGLQVSITADLPSPETDQVTTYTFGTTKGSGLGASLMASGRLVKTIAYPDSSGGSDVVTFAYNAQGQEIYKKDQGGNEIESLYDDSGRPTAKKVTTVGSGFDSTIRYIGTGYDSSGRRETVTQYSNTGGSTVVDQVKYTYDNWGNVSKFEQDRDGTVGGGGNQYTVEYTYAKATTGRNTVRVSTETWPSGKDITYEYKSSSSWLDDASSRVTNISEGHSFPPTKLVTYDYNGLDQVVGTYYEQPDVMRRFYPTTPNGTYPDLDQFDRVTTDKWTKDLATDKNFWNVAVGWDRNSNVTYQDDAVHTGVDALYTNDDLNRLVRSYEGTYSAGSISSAKRDQQWTLTQVGDWTYDKLDLNGDADFVDASEWNDHRTHNDVNEILTRDLDNNSGTGGDNYTLTHDAAGDLTNDGKDYKYEWDAFYRLRYVKNQSNAVVAEYKYDGLNYRLSEHGDTDSDGDVDGSDKWYHTAYDTRWRAVATFRESDTSPKEQFFNHNAGLGGQGGASYIDLLAWRDKDANTAWTSAADGTLEERIYYCQNWRADVSVLVTVTGTMLQWDKYSAYGVPYGIPGGDCTSDFTTDSTDSNQVQTWINGSVYDVRGDIDLDGDVDANDKSTIIANFITTILGRESLSSSWNNRRGGAGREYRGNSAEVSQQRMRIYATTFGRWGQRDPMGYVDGLSLYEGMKSSPIVNVDPLGLTAGIECGTSVVDLKYFSEMITFTVLPNQTIQMAFIRACATAAQEAIMPDYSCDMCDLYNPCEQSNFTNITVTGGFSGKGGVQPVSWVSDQAGGAGHSGFCNATVYVSVVCRACPGLSDFSPGHW